MTLARSVAVLAVFLSLGTHVQAARKYEGVQVSIVMSEWAMRPFGPYVQRFYEETGCNVTLVRDDSASLIKRITAASESGFGEDGYMILPVDLPQLARSGHIRDLTDKIRGDDKLAWDDLLPFYRDQNSAYRKRTYGMPSDGGLIGMFGRQDLVPVGSEPETVEELLEMVKRLDGQDLNGDGIPDRGWCECRGPTDDILTTLVNGEYVMQFIATYMQTKGPKQGIWFDPVTIEAQIDHEGFRKGFEMALAVWQAGTRATGNECNRHADSTSGMNIPRIRWGNGTCAFSMNWQGGILRDFYLENTYSGVGTNRTRIFPFPGTTHVDIDKNLTECTETSCPYAVKGRSGKLVNYAPYAALGGGYTLLIGTHSQHFDATFDFMSHLIEPKNSAEWVTDRQSASFEPFRASHLYAPGWEKEWGKDIADQFIETVRFTNIGEKNIAPDSTLPEAPFFSLDVGTVFAKALEGNLTVDESLEEIRKLWLIRAERNGLEKVRDLYRETMGMSPYAPPTVLTTVEDALEGWHIALIVVGGAIAVLVILFLVYKYRKSNEAYRLQFADNVVAARCAKAIASMQLDQVAYLQELKTPNAIQASFIEIVSRMNQYKAYMPQSLFVNDVDDSTEEESSLAKDRGSGSRGPASILSKSSQHSKKSRSTTATMSLAHHREKVNLSTEVKKRKVSLVVTSLKESLMDKAAADVSTTMASYLEAVQCCVSKYRGIVDEVIGDKVHSSYNTTQPSIQHGSMALQCVVGMKKEFKQDVVSAAVSGQVMCGNVGCTGLMRYGIIGQPELFVWSVHRLALDWGCGNLCDEGVCRDGLNFELRTVARVKANLTKDFLMKEAMRKIETECDEWMYELDKQEQDNRYHAYNKAVTCLYIGEFNNALNHMNDSNTDHDDELTARIKKFQQLVAAPTPVPCEMKKALDVMYTDADYNGL